MHPCEARYHEPLDRMNAIDMCGSEDGWTSEKGASTGELRSTGSADR